MLENRQDPSHQTALARLVRCWGKSGATTHQFHPALYHMLDVGYVAAQLLSPVASPRWRHVLGRALGVDPEGLQGWLPWLIALHDIGKLSASFQSLADDHKQRLLVEGFSFGGWRPSLDVPHAQIGQAFATRHHEAILSGHVGSPALAELIGHMVGGHHGRYLARDSVRETARILATNEPPDWNTLRLTAVEVLRQALVVEPPDRPVQPVNRSAAAFLLTGFAILCDWLGSNGQYFRPRPDLPQAAYVRHSQSCAERAVMDAGFAIGSSSQAPTHFVHLFPRCVPPRPLQVAIDQIPNSVLAAPCLAVIEAPTGEGKTEAALALAHRLARATGGTDELYYALPTTATSNQMFTRVRDYLADQLHLAAQVKLVHGQAHLIEDDLRAVPLEDADALGRAAMLEWFSPLKRAVLAPFGVGTVDQAELAALNVRHVALRLLGLAGKVVIFDEVHAYDTYMTTIVERLLTWLAELGTSVILMSATLPRRQRDALVRAYGCDTTQSDATADGYPRIWVGGRAGVFVAHPPAHHPDHRLRIRTLHLQDGQDEAKARWLLAAVAEGGCACWIANTVNRAQRIYDSVIRLASSDVACSLLHAQFPLEERQALETDLTHRYGRCGDRPRRGIVVGTQVLEQSLDLDFDVMVSDLAPVDLLLQRAGRLHRHARQRPMAHGVPMLYVNAPLDPQGYPCLTTDAHIYAEYTLRQTWQRLSHLSVISLPADYRRLVEAVYADLEPASDELLARAWERLKKDRELAVQEANLRLLPEPDPDSLICARTAALEFEEDENSAAWIIARTRLGEESLTVIPLERDDRRARATATEEWLDIEAPASRELQLRLLRRSLRISRPDAVVALRRNGVSPPRLFAESALLRRCVPLWLHHGVAKLPSGHGTLEMRLDPSLGLVIRRE